MVLCNLKLNPRNLFKKMYKFYVVNTFPVQVIVNKMSMYRNFMFFYLIFQSLQRPR